MMQSWSFNGLKALITGKSAPAGKQLKASRKPSAESSSSSSEEDEETQVHDEMSGQLASEDQFLHSDDPRVATWTAEEIYLFNKLSSRGFEPLMPAKWQWDFTSFPDVLFTAKPKAQLLANLSTTVTEAANELNALVQAGPRCRDAISSGCRPEAPLAHSIRQFFRWAWRDAKLTTLEHPLTMVTATATAGETVQDLVNRITKNLQQHAVAWQAELEQIRGSAKVADIEAPTLCGFVIKFSIVGIVTLDAAAAKTSSSSWSGSSTSASKPVRTLATLDFQQEGQDVWAALAIAIMAMRSRRYVMQLAEAELLEEKLQEVSNIHEEDA